MLVSCHEILCCFMKMVTKACRLLFYMRAAYIQHTEKEMMFMEKDANIEIVREHELFQRREEIMYHISYAHEKILCHVITEGHIDGLNKALQIPPDGTVGILSNNELRHYKNLLIASITLFTRAAINGGLAEELAFAMSDSYIRNGEKCTSIQEVHQIYMRSLKEFTYAVAKEQKQRHSAKIEPVIHYIQIHLHEKITLQMVAEAVGISACYLSRLFKKEMGISLVEYVQKERVEAARHMLIYSDYTEAVISEYLNFTTQSYFTIIFKKYIGMTPSQYRKRYRKNDNW